MTRRPEIDAAAADRAARRVLTPYLSRPHPSHVGGGAGGPDHHGVVGVGHHHRAVGPVRRGGGGQAADRLPPPLDHHPHLGDPVELVPRKIEEDHHPWSGLLDEPAQIALVDLEHGRGTRRHPTRAAT